MDMTYCRFANKLGKQYIFSSMVTLLCISNLLFSIIIISILHIAPTIKHLPVRYANYMATILTLDSCRLQILNLFAVNLLVQLPGFAIVCFYRITHRYMAMAIQQFISLCHQSPTLSLAHFIGNIIIVLVDICYMLHFFTKLYLGGLESSSSH